jgi:hypothetical protein
MDQIPLVASDESVLYGPSASFRDVEVLYKLSDPPIHVHFLKAAMAITKL